jgi:hypothetical protein
LLKVRLSIRPSLSFPPKWLVIQRNSKENRFSSSRDDPGKLLISRLCVRVRVQGN